MEYRVEISDEAEAELDAAYLFLSERSPNAAFQWYAGVRSAIKSLSMFPRRCPVAHENASYPDKEVRQLLYGTGRSTYRIFFMIFEDDAEVRIVQFRHAARPPRQQTQEDED
jgi:plasmid stabilization system protein ParE